MAQNKDKTKEKIIDEASSRLADIFINLIDDKENKKKEDIDIKKDERRI